MRVIEQNMDVPMPQILEEIVEIGAIVDILVLQFDFILQVSSVCCGKERCTSFSVYYFILYEFYFLINTSRNRIAVSFTFYRIWEFLLMWIGVMTPFLRSK